MTLKRHILPLSGIATTAVLMAVSKTFLELSIPLLLLMFFMVVKNCLDAVEDEVY